MHVIGHEADGVANYREWSQKGHPFLVRADANRWVYWEGKSILLSDLARRLSRAEAFQNVRETKYHGRKARQWVTETEIVLDRPGRKRTAQGHLLAVWFLLSNVPTDISAATLAVWYYWRWGIESFFKLITSYGQQLESWLQETGLKIAKRLLVASMACAMVWQLQHEQSPAAHQFEQMLVTISG